MQNADCIADPETETYFLKRVPTRKLSDHAFLNFTATILFISVLPRPSNYVMCVLVGEFLGGTVGLAEDLRNMITKWNVWSRPLY